jgi:hypothetical protein
LAISADSVVLMNWRSMRNGAANRQPSSALTAARTYAETTTTSYTETTIPARTLQALVWPSNRHPGRSSFFSLYLQGHEPMSSGSASFSVVLCLCSRLNGELLEKPSSHRVRGSAGLARERGIWHPCVHHHVGSHRQDDLALSLPNMLF